MEVIKEDVETKQEDLRAINNQMQFVGKVQDVNTDSNNIHSSFIPNGQISRAMEKNKSVLKSGDKDYSEDDECDTPRVQYEENILETSGLLSNRKDDNNEEMRETLFLQPQKPKGRGSVKDKVRKKNKKEQEGQSCCTGCSTF